MLVFELKVCYEESAFPATWVTYDKYFNAALLVSNFNNQMNGTTLYIQSVAEVSDTFVHDSHLEELNDNMNIHLYLNDFVYD